MPIRGDNDRPYSRHKLTISCPEGVVLTPLQEFAAKASMLGKLLTDMPPDYREAWSDERPDLLSYSATVATLVCQLSRDTRNLDAPGARLPVKVSAALPALRTLLDSWVERWGIEFHASSGCDLWSTTQGAGGSAWVKHIDTGPPCIDVTQQEIDRLRWAFQQLREVVEPTPSKPPARKPEAHDQSASSRPKAPRRSAGTLDERAAIELKKNPSLTFDQLANIVGCHPTTLRNRNRCPLLSAAKDMLRAERDRFRKGDEWNDRSEDDF